MKPSPCLHPVKITNYRGHVQMVPCGHCSACLVNKGRQRAEVLSDSINQYPYKFFITLTFNDEHLPLARWDVASAMIYHDLDCDYLGEVHHRTVADLPLSNFEFIEKCNEKYGGIPVLSHQVLIKWKKRFRYYFKKYYKHAKIFLYSVGEYGPESYRPHYHCIFCTDAPIKTSFLRMCVDSSWQERSQVQSQDVLRSFGFVDVQRITNRGCERYVASYLACTTHLPKVLQQAPWRPFATKSTDTDSRLSFYGLSDLRRVFDSNALTISVHRNGKQSHIPVPSFIQNRLWPRIPRFGSFSCDGLRQLYSIYDKGLRFEQLKEPMVRSYNLQGLKEYLPFDGQEEYVSYKKIEPEYITLVKDLVFKNAKGDWIDDEEIQKRNFMRLWYVSRRVSQNARTFGISVRDYVNHIIEYWHLFEIDKLKRFYEMQQDLLDDPYNPIDLDSLFSLYYNTDDSECDIDYYFHQFNARDGDVMNIAEQRKYAQLSERILLDTTKTKKRNDNYMLRGKKRKVFVPHLSRKINSFLSN